MMTLVIPLSWQHGLGGGLLIGASAVVLLWMLGRIAGISGILGGLLQPGGAGDRAWRILFLSGLLFAGLLLAPLPTLAPGSTPSLLIVAGFLVGFGSRMGSGCTSGHGVCGLGRLSWRSLVATVTFMSTGFATVFFMRHGGF